MRSFVVPVLLCTCCHQALTSSAHATVARRGDAYVLSGANYSIAFSATNGSILSVTQGAGGGSLFRSGEYGLWQARWRDDTRLNAADFSAGANGRTFSGEMNPATNALRMDYRSPDIDVAVTLHGRPDGVDFAARVTPTKNVVLDLSLPARLRFEPAQMTRLVCPANGNNSVGTAFHSSFFGVQPQDPPVGWSQHMIGGQSYAALYGGPLVQRENNDPPTSLSVTATGREWLGEALATRVSAARAVVNRPPTAAQAERTLVDSRHGPYLSANSLGGQGSIWRVGGAVTDAEAPLVADMVTTVVAHLEARPPAGRTMIGVLALQNGPERGGWTSVMVATWLAHLKAIDNGQVQLVELTKGAMLRDALNGDDFLAILNPYGEWCPALPNADMPATVDAVRRYVRGGGNWFEVGGYPFFYALTPQQYLEYSTQYPDAFADFLHFETRTGSSAL